MFDEKLTKAVQFDYKVIEEFTKSGNKVPEILSHTAIFVDFINYYPNLGKNS